MKPREAEMIIRHPKHRESTCFLELLDDGSEPHSSWAFRISSSQEWRLLKSHKKQSFAWNLSQDRILTIYPALEYTFQLKM